MRPYPYGPVPGWLLPANPWGKTRKQLRNEGCGFRISKKTGLYPGVVESLPDSRKFSGWLAPTSAYVLPHSHNLPGAGAPSSPGFPSRSATFIGSEILPLAPPARHPGLDPVPIRQPLSLYLSRVTEPPLSNHAPFRVFIIHRQSVYSRGQWLPDFGWDEQSSGIYYHVHSEIK